MKRNQLEVINELKQEKYKLMEEKQELIDQLAFTMIELAHAKNDILRLEDELRLKIV